jgi:hypothetical protein
VGDQRSAAPPPRGRRGEVITGRLQEHGKANYQFQPDGSPSYYLTLLTSRGPETLWGTDLERAIARSESQPKIGAVVGVQRVGSDPVTIPARDGERRTDQQRTFHRARWRVEEVTYLAKSMQSAERAVKSRLEDKRAMTERPELRSAFISLHVAQQYAEKNPRSPRSGPVRYPHQGRDGCIRQERRTGPGATSCGRSPGARYTHHGPRRTDAVAGP